MPHDYVFPSRYIAGCNRRFNNQWIDDFPCIVYSKGTDSAFCLPCTLFVEEKREHLSLLVNKPFRKWSKKKDTINPHAECLYHTCAMQVADGLIHSIETPQSTIPALSCQRKHWQKQTHCEMCCRSCDVVQQTMHRVTRGQGRPQERRKSRQFPCPNETDGKPRSNIESTLGFTNPEERNICIPENSK